MNIDRILVKNILANLVIFLVLFNIISFVYFIVFAGIDFSWWLLIIPFFLMQVIRARMMKIPVFVLLHMILIAVPVAILGSQITLWFILLFMILAVAYSCFAKKFGERDLQLKTALKIFAMQLLMFLIAGMGAGQYVIFRHQLTMTTLVMIAVIVLYIQLHNVDINVMSTQIGDDRKHDTIKVLNINNRLIAVFVSVLVTLAMFVIFFPVMGMVVVVGHSIVRFVTMVIEFVFPPILYAFNVIISPIMNFLAWVIDQGHDLEYVAPPEFLPGYSEEEYIVGQPGIAFQTIAAIIIGFFFVMMILTIIIILRGSDSPLRNILGASKEGVKGEHTSLAHNILGDLRDLLPRFGGGSSNVVRREYAKKVTKHIVKGVNIHRSDTTDIIADKIRHRENIDGLTLKYEEVRYGK
ncbi:MAG: hypothetical protein FWE05_01470 [Defluviitaleaceae bacterium]|nr:hypothetical protein [Defluviitaleaceae bacterium]